VPGVPGNPIHFSASSKYLVYNLASGHQMTAKQQKNGVWREKHFSKLFE